MVKKRCVVCKNEFECYDKISKQHYKLKRPFNSITCSPKCSRQYQLDRQQRKFKALGPKAHFVEDDTNARMNIDNN